MSVRVVDNFPDAHRRGKAAADKAAERGAKRLLERANESVPRDEGDLEASGEVAKVEDGQFAVQYTAPYAARQHEDLGLSHPGGGRAKWLELASEEKAEEVGKEMANGAKEAF